jgi:hypothetical protein
MVWQTYLVMYFGTGDGKPSEVVKRVESIGFTTTFGPVDFVYIWPSQPTKEQVLELADKLTEALKETGCVFNLDTHD